jgi:ABC-2 type transport system permease protein
MTAAAITAPRMPRLTAVELRKATDTRAGFWLLLLVVLSALAVVAIVLAAGDPEDQTFASLFGDCVGIVSVLLPIVGLLLVTSEWSQRTALVTFTLMPVRGRVLLAKVLAALIAGLAAILLAIAVAAVATLLGGAPDAWARIGADDFAKFGLLQVSGVLQGLAFGLLFLSSAAAIVTFFVLPTAFTIVANLWGALRDAAPWVDLGTAQQPLFSGTDLTGEQWLQVTTATLIWVVLPFVVGMVRVLRAEVK